MKKSTICILGILAFMGVYTTSFADADWTRLATIFDYILSGVISTAFICIAWNIFFGEEKTDTKDAKEEDCNTK